MKVLGLLFIIAGVCLCLTVFFIPYGAPLVIAGALLYMAGTRNPRERPEVTHRPANAWLIAGSLAIALVGLVWYAKLMQPAAPIPPAAARQTVAGPQSSPPAHTAKHRVPGH